MNNIYALYTYAITAYIISVNRGHTPEGKVRVMKKFHEYTVCESHSNPSFTAYNPEYIITEIQNHEWNLTEVEICDMVTNVRYYFFDFCKAYNNGEL